MKKSDEMTREEAFEILDSHSENMNIQYQEYLTLMDNHCLAYYGKDILNEMENNGETWDDVEDYRIRKNAHGAHPFYIWTSKFVYFVSMVQADLAGPVFHIKSIPRNPTEDITNTPKWI